MTRQPVPWILGLGVLLALVIASAWLVVAGEPSQRGIDGVLVYPLPDESHYRHSTDPHVVEIGYRPLLVPSANVLEVMRRDRVLARDCAQQGLVLRFVPFLNPLAQVAAFDQGLDGAIVGGVDALVEAVRHHARIISPFPAMIFSIVCRGGRRVSDLKGCRIACARGDTLEYILKRALAVARLNPDDVTIDYETMPDLLRKLLDGKVDAFAAMEPIPTLALRNVPDLAAVGNWSGELDFIVTRSLHASRPGLLQRFVAAQIRALNWLRASGKNLHMASGWVREAQAPFLARGLIVDLFDYNRLASSSASDLAASLDTLVGPGMHDRDLGSVTAFAMARGLIPKDTTAQVLHNALDRDVLVQVLAQPAKMQLSQSDVERTPF